MTEVLRMRSKRDAVLSSLQQWLKDNAEPPSTLPLFDGPSLAENYNMGASEAPDNIEPELDSEQHPIVSEFDTLSAPYEGVYQDEALMNPGDLVELPDPVKTDSLAVYLQSSQRASIYYTLQGKLIAQSRRACYFVVPNFFPPEEVLSITGYLTPAVIQRLENETGIPDIVPVSVGAPAQRMMVDFANRAADYYRQNPSLFDKMLNAAASKSQPRFLLLADLADKIWRRMDKPIPEGGYDPAFLYAVNTAALRTKYGFHVDVRSLAQVGGVLVEPYDTVATVYIVRGWLRAWQELQAGGYDHKRQTALQHDSRPIQDFISQARKLVHFSRSIRNTSPDGHFISTMKLDSGAWSQRGIDPSAKFHVEHTFSDSDCQIIHFLTRFSEMDGLSRYKSIQGLIPNLIRAIDVYPEDLDVDRGVVHNFLIELGVVEPFDSAAPYERRLYQSGLEMRGPMDSVPEEEALDLTSAEDSMKDVRRDWGDLPVYVIDRADTRDADDGISIQQVDGEPGKIWLHVHISHVSAFVPPKSHVARQAERRLTSYYFPEVTLPMLPKWATEAYSVTGGAAVMTHSMKIDMDTGQTVEYALTPSRVNNVIRMTPSDVDIGLLGRTQFDSTLLRWETRGYPNKTKDDRLLLKFDDQTVSDLLKFHEVCKVMLKSSSIHLFNEKVMNMEVSAQYSKSKKNLAAFSTQTERFQARYPLEDPATQLVVKKEPFGSFDFESDVSPANLMVQLAMTECCVQASKWAAERDLPLPFYGTKATAALSDELRDNLRDRFVQASKGELKLNVVQGLLQLMRNIYGTRAVSSYPLEQRFIRQRAYTKITSPLRRYFDLLAMWQIDAAVREEARSGSSVVSRKNQDFLPCTRSEVNEQIARHERSLLAARRFSSSHTKHWAVVAFARAFYYGEGGDLPRRLTAYVTQISAEKDLVSVALDLVPLVATAGSGLGTEDGCRAAIGERWEVEPVAVRLSGRDVQVKLLRRIEEADESVTIGDVAS